MDPYLSIMFSSCAFLVVLMIEARALLGVINELHPKLFFFFFNF